MNTPIRDSTRTPRRYPAAWITLALLALAPVGALVSQDAPKPATPEEGAPAAKEAPPAAKKTPASKPAADSTKPAADSTKASTAKAPAAGADKGEAGKAAANGEQADKGDDIDKSQAPTIFVPTQKTSADNSATFPIDI